MSTGVLSIKNNGFDIKNIQEEIQDSNFVLEIKEEDKPDDSLLWRQINKILKETVRSVSESTEKTNKEDVEQKSEKILIAPGILVTMEEYKERFGGIDLEKYKKEMSPELFKVFVRHIGSIKGNTKLDIVELTSHIED